MTALQALAQRCGISLKRADPRGGGPVSPDTLKAILAALGVEADSNERAAGALAELERRAWSAAVAEVAVVREGAVAVELVLPAATRQVSWHLLTEDGAERTGLSAFAELPLLGRDDKDGRAGRRKERRRLALGGVPLGHHRLSLEPQGATCTLVVTPARCYWPALDDAHGLWGIALQLYLLRSARNFGIGDFGDLTALAPALASRGCNIVGLNPLHAPFPDDPDHASPYSPASRLLLNPLNIDIEATRETCESPAAAELLRDATVLAELASCRAADSVEYRRVAALKERLLDAAFGDWRRAGEVEAANDLAAFRAAQGASFERHCLYFALRAHLLREGLAPGDWHRWPRELQDARGAAAVRFARSHADDVTRVAWQQWLADRQLEAAARAAQGMRIGLYRDLAVGADAAGADTWAERELFAEELRIGAPPDELSASGQEWGLPAPHPERMRAGGYRVFGELTRANMRHAGALRVDHVMALERLYVIPKGAAPAEGAYLAYPFADLSGVLALESARRRCVVIGEDLGLVPEGFRERMRATNVLSYRVVRFEREPHRFFGPQEYPRAAVAVVGNHDLPTLAAWWQGADLVLEHEHGALSGEDFAAARQRRDADRRALLALLHREGLMPWHVQDPSYEELFGATHALLGRTRALLVLAQLDDVLRELAPVNVPSTQRYASWRRRYSRPVEALADEPLLAMAAAAIGGQRSS
jgi:4-alpha-glucanotransferase